MSVCDPICDFCTHYAFNANEDGAYTGDGECRHQDHPGPKEPWEDCGDFACDLCGPSHTAAPDDHREPTS